MPMNNRTSVPSEGTSTLVGQLSEPLYEGQLASLVKKSPLSIALLDLSRTHDVELYNRLFNSGDFDVLSDSEHSTRHAVVVVIRYLHLKGKPLGPTASEIFTRELDAERSAERKAQRAELAARKRAAEAVKKVDIKKTKKTTKAKPRQKKRGSIGPNKR